MTSATATTTATTRPKSVEVVFSIVEGNDSDATPLTSTVRRMFGNTTEYLRFISAHLGDIAPDAWCEYEGSIEAGFSIFTDSEAETLRWIRALLPAPIITAEGVH